MQINSNVEIIKKYTIPFLFLCLTLILKKTFSYSGLIFFHFSTAFLISFVLIPIIIKLCFKFNILDIPSGRKIHSMPTPKLGGIAVFLGFLISTLLIPHLSSKIYGLICASALIFLTGVLDDIYGLSAKSRLLIHLISVSLIIFLGIYLTLFHKSSLGGNFLNIGLTLFWIVGITNAFNFLDGMNGEASGLGIIISLTLALFAYINGDRLISLVLISVVGAVCGFIPYNLKNKADIFLGDGGSNFLGFFLSAMAVLIEWGSSPGCLNLILPVMVFFICIYDTTMTTVTRIYSGKIQSCSEWIKYTGKDHIHHLFSELFSGNKLLAVFSIYFLAIHSSIFVILYSYYRGNIAISLDLVKASLIQTTLLYLFISWAFFKMKQKHEKEPLPRLSKVIIQLFLGIFSRF